VTDRYPVNLGTAITAKATTALPTGAPAGGAAVGAAGSAAFGAARTVTGAVAELLAGFWSAVAGFRVPQRIRLSQCPAPQRGDANERGDRERRDAEA
jgi:hypothetical protein